MCGTQLLAAVDFIETTSMVLMIAYNLGEQIELEAHSRILTQCRDRRGLATFKSPPSLDFQLDLSRGHLSRLRSPHESVSLGLPVPRELSTTGLSQGTRHGLAGGAAWVAV